MARVIEVLQTVLPVVIMLGIGMVCRSRKIISREGIGALKSVVVNIALPAVLLSAFATTKYHVFRSGLYAKRVKLQAEGIGSDTKWYFWPNASVRELVGLMTEHRGKQALVLLGMIAVYVTLAVISFKF